MLVRKAITAWRLIECFGPRWLLGRAVYAAQRKSGWWERRLPAKPWESFPLSGLLAEPRLADPELLLAKHRGSGPRFFFAANDRSRFQVLLRQFDAPASATASIGNLQALDTIADADALAAGKIRFFSDQLVETQFPPQWHRQVESGAMAPRDVHWSRLDEFAFGDIKLLWEPARFSFAFTLARAYWRSGDERYPELFWQAVESFWSENPPQLGVHWKCGQETSLRLLAWTFGLHAFLHSPATTADRVAQLVQMVAVSAERVEANFAYAQSQSNNHSVSEAAGLYTVGLLFPELRSAARWHRRGKQLLEHELRRLIYADGAFSQHSTNYHRLMLQTATWSLRLGELNHDPFSSDVCERVRRAADFLAAMTDPETGAAPNYGHNDGALLLPLSNCGYGDFRPAVQAARLLLDGERTYAAGVWDEESLWLLGADALRADSPADKSPCEGASSAGGIRAFTESGYVVLQSSRCQVVTRAARFNNRPSQADQLHVDVRWRNIPIAIDAGTFRYNAADPWNNSLGDTQYHNTVSVDGENQMRRAGRFLWMPWSYGGTAATCASSNAQLLYWEGTHDGYGRRPILAKHRRAVWLLGPDVVLVYDLLSSPRPHNYRLHWLLADAPHAWEAARGTLRLSTSAGDYFVHATCNADSVDYSVEREDAATPRGWTSPTYNSKRPAISLAAVAQAKIVTFCTLFAPEAMEVHQSPTEIALSGASLAARLKFAGSQWPYTLFSIGELERPATERLKIDVSKPSSSRMFPSRP